MTFKPTIWARPQDAFTKQMWVGDLVEMFKYSTYYAVMQAIKRGTFPIHTYKLAGRRVADISVIVEYFKKQTALAETKLEDTKQKLYIKPRARRANPKGTAPVVAEHKAPVIETSDSFFGRTVPRR